MTFSGGKIEVAVICGPTASGKTEKAVEMAGTLNGEIVSVDSVQVYRGMDIGTAKPDVALRKRHPHHMIDIIDPDQPFDAAGYARLAGAAIQDIAGRGKLPVLAGGTGLYFKALLEGLFEGPGADPKIREKWQRMAEEKGQDWVYGRLMEKDPETASSMHANNLRRVIRALEVMEICGEKMSVLKRADAGKPPFIIRERIFLNPPRDELYGRIDRRTEEMFNNGLVEEVRGLLARYSPGLPSLKTIGYREVVDLLAGKLTRIEAIELIKKRTRNYAKRQITWFKNQKTA